MTGSKPPAEFLRYVEELRSEVERANQLESALQAWFAVVTEHASTTPVGDAAAAIELLGIAEEIVGLLTGPGYDSVVRHWLSMQAETE
ncbi:hypothetical protein [Mycobacterium paragordonae]|uniref:hypothetical protein n=1 Tax=Mycobacterium paragordonae TaxID=1389713 RepID=UPI0012E1F3E8|nr:hypothetical protein [Mycobacterium paragordonae]